VVIVSKSSDAFPAEPRLTSHGRSAWYCGREAYAPIALESASARPRGARQFKKFPRFFSRLLPSPLRRKAGKRKERKFFDCAVAIHNEIYPLDIYPQRI
jgi:hypothetical protein